MTYAEWIKENPPPDLEALVQQFRGYGHIPPAAWADYDRQLTQWRARYYLRHMDEERFIKD